MFVMGACGLVYEYVLSVLGNYLMGSSHEEIFVIIGLMMFAMGVGSFAQRLIRKDLFDRFLLLESILGIVGGFAASLVFYLFAVSESYRVVLYGMSFLIGMLIGMEIPILIRINKEYSASLKTNLSEILSMDYAGALAGALLFAYVLLTNVDLTRIAFVLGLSNAFIAVLGWIVLRDRLVRPKFTGAFIVIVFAALSYGFAKAPQWDEWSEQRFFADPIVYRETSRYQHIVITDSPRTGITRLYINGHLQFSSHDEQIYHECLVHPAMTIAPSRRNVLILGGGDGLALREVLSYPDVESITLVDLDPSITRLAREHPDLVRMNGGALSDSRLRVLESRGITEGEPFVPKLHSQRPTRRFLEAEELPEVHVRNVDAELFLREAAGPYDVAILDFPDPSRLEVAKLYSRSFYRLLSSRLSPGAIVSVQSTSPFHARLVFLCIGETLRSAGFSAVPLRQDVPSFGMWGFHVATVGPDSEDSLRSRLRGVDSLRVETDYITPELLAAATHFGKGALDPRPGDPSIEPNTRLKPTLVQYHRRSWIGY